MTTDHTHHDNAEQCIARAARAREFNDRPLAAQLLQEAQVHALLALAEADRPAPVQITVSDQEGRSW